MDLSHKPRLLSELSFIPFDGGILVDGTGSLHILRGLAATDLLPLLMVHANGEHTITDLVRLLPNTTQAALESVLSTLFTWGVIEYVSEQTDSSLLRSHSTAIEFFRRYSSSTGWNISGEQALTRIVHTRVVIVSCTGSEVIAQDCLNLLKVCGFIHVTAANIGVIDSIGPDQRPDLLIVSLGAIGEDTTLNLTLAEWARHSRVRWLRVVMDHAQGFADIGPLFSPQQIVCYRCSQLSSPPQLGISGPSTEGATKRAIDAIWVGMVATEVVYLVSRTGQPVSERGYRRFELPRWKSRLIRTTSLRGCPECSLLPPSAESPVQYILPQSFDQTDSVYVYEDYILRVSSLRSTRYFEHKRAASLEALSRDFKLMPNSPAFSLPLLDPVLVEVSSKTSGRSKPSPSNALSLEHVQLMLKAAAGGHGTIQGEPVSRRWAASSGNLGSVELYIIVRRVAGIRAGLYFYQAFNHSICEFEQHGAVTDIDELLRQSLGMTEHFPSALVVFTGAFHRLYRKYEEFAFKLLQLDAGVAVTQLQIAAEALKLSATPLPFWADSVFEKRLNLEPFHEQCTAVVALESGESSPSSYPFSELASTVALRSKRKTADFSYLTIGEVTQLLYRDSRMQEGDFTADRGSWDLTIGRDLRRTSPGLDFDAGSSSHVLSLLEGRRSIRTFSSQTVSLSDILRIILHAYANDLKNWPVTITGGVELQFCVLARRVDAAPSVYRFRPDFQDLAPTGPLPSLDDCSELFVQPTFGAAPITIWIFADLRRTCELHGAVGYRHLLLRAGAAANRVWIKALGLGLSGTIVGGLVTSTARKHLGIDRFLDTSLCAFVSGYR